jgi:hypothetical protein
MHQVTPRRHVISLVDADPDLVSSVPEADLEEVHRRAVAACVEVRGPRWDPSELVESAGSGWLGLFVLDGLLVRRVRVAGRTSCELFGPGDLTRPWDEDGEYAPLAVNVDWLVLQPARVAILDDRFSLRVARWPSINATLVQRVAARARKLAIFQAVTHLPRTHARILLLFWLLAERWGAVSTAGVVVKLPLTHQVLAMLVGSHRPTVTLALQKLARRELLVRESSSRWLLTQKGIDCLAHPSSLSLIGADKDLDADEPLPEVADIEPLDSEIEQIAAETEASAADV